EASVYDMTSQTEVFFSDVEKYILAHTWLEDGRIKLLLNETRTWEVGLEREYLLLDPATGGQETLIEEISLPGYHFNDEIPHHGFSAMSPSGEFALYTANTTQGVEIRLLDLHTEEILWRQSTNSLPGP